MPPTFLALYFGDLVLTGVGMAMLVSKTHVPTPHWNLRLDISGNSAGVQLLEICLSLCWWDLSMSQAFSVHVFSLTCSFPTFSNFRSTSIQKVPLRCLSWSRRDWSTQTPILICYPSSSTACRCHVSTSQFSRVRGIEELGEALIWVQCHRHALPLSSIQNLAVAKALGILRWLHPAESCRNT